MSTIVTCHYLCKQTCFTAVPRNNLNPHACKLLKYLNVVSSLSSIIYYHLKKVCIQSMFPSKLYSSLFYLPALLSWHAQLVSLGFKSRQLLSSWTRTRAQTRFFLSNSNSITWPRVSSCSCCQFSILPAIWFPFNKSSSSQGFRQLVTSNTCRPFSSLRSSKFWLICRSTRSL